MKKKIFVLAIVAILSLVFVLFQIPLLKFLFDRIEYALFTYETYAGTLPLIEIPLFTESLTRVLFLILLIVSFIVSIAYIIFKQIKGSNASNFARYTYEEYKQYREKKKVEKQAKKKAKLQEKLQEIEKTE